MLAPSRWGFRIGTNPEKPGADKVKCNGWIFCFAISFASLFAAPRKGPAEEEGAEVKQKQHWGQGNTNRSWLSCRSFCQKASGKSNPRKKNPPVQSSQSLNWGWNLAFVKKKLLSGSRGRVNPRLLLGFLLRVHSNTVGKGFNELVELYP